MILGGLLLAAAATVFLIQPPVPAAKSGVAHGSATAAGARREYLGTARMPNDRLGVLLLYSLLRSRAAP